MSSTITVPDRERIATSVSELAEQLVAVATAARSDINNVLVDIGEEEDLMAFLNLAALASTNEQVFDNGKTVTVTSLGGAFWVLDKTSTLTADGITIIATNSGTGRWLRVLSHIPKWTNQVAWGVNAVTGNDENVGSEASPLKTVAELTRRLQRMKYSPSFGPYTVKLFTDIPLTDSAQFSALLESTSGDIGQDPDVGITDPIMIVTGTKTTVGTGTLTVVTPPVGANDKYTLTRGVTAFALNDIVEFTTGPSAGLRTYPEEAGFTTTINPRNLNGTLPAAGNAFNLVQLTKFCPQVTWIGGLSGGPRLVFRDVWVPGDGQFGTFDNGGPAQYECNDMSLRWEHCLLNQLIHPGRGASMRFGSAARPTAVICPAGGPDLGFLIIQRGLCTSNHCSFVNVVVDVMASTSFFLGINCEFVGGLLRGGGPPGETTNFGAGTPWIQTDTLRTFDWPATVPASALYTSGGTTESGAGMILNRGFYANTNASWVGSSAAAGTVGLKISNGATYERGPGSLPTVTGPVNAIEMSGGGSFPHVDDTNAIVVSALTQWTGAGGFDDAATFDGRAMNLRDGTAMYTTA